MNTLKQNSKKKIKMKYKQFNHIILLVFYQQLKLILLQQSPQLTDTKSFTLDFYEEPTDTYLTKSAPATLKCKIENARTIFFKCNEKWSKKEGDDEGEEDTATFKSKLVQIGNKQILTTEMTVTSAQLDEYTKTILSKDSDLIPEFWCTCHGWVNSVDDMVISRKAFIKLACMYIFTQFIE